ncbi:hypothetical protein [Candidatus Korobacter versatilis]|nr:hypothetical protein [Candidatus Koribacter versatilis]
MEWIFGAVLVVTIGLYVWSIGWTGRRITRKIQPFIDDLFGTQKRPPK